MAFSVADFTGIISSKGLASSNKFEVEIYFPTTLSFPGNIEPALIADNSKSIADLNLMCDSATILGKNIQSIADLQYGIRREIAYASPTYDPLILSFYCTEKLEEKKLLDKWQRLMVETPEKNGKESFDVGYYDTYAKDSKINVTKLGVDGEKTFTYEYREAYPKTISALELSQDASSSPMKITATFNYVYWVDVT